MEFRSKLEDALATEELRFGSTPGFGSAYKKFLSHAIAHPAKANMKLLEFLIENFTVEGDTVLDPMAGSGSTGVVAALHGRNAVQVDIEKKFVKWAEEAKRKVEMQTTLTAKGLIRNICGDSRKLSELLKSADVVLTSPPYSETIHKRAEYSKRVERLERQERDFFQHLGKSLQTQDGDVYIKSKGNIGNLPHGSIDTIVTSPPYSNAISKQGGSTGVKNVGISTITSREYSRDPSNIANLPHGNVDAVIGRTTKETYLEAMLKVYMEMFKVLKPNGLCIIVIKPFIRNKQVVDLPYHTWLLLEKVGFKLVKLFKLRLQQESFWRILYHKKYKDVPKMAHEYVLITQKPLTVMGE